MIEIVIVLVLTVLNGLLAMSELAVASSRVPRLKFMIEQGVNGARRALALASDPGRFLSTVQIGITLIGIVQGVVSGAALGGRLAGWLQGFGLAANIAEPLGFGLIVAIITYLSLVIGELVPKQIALKNPERIACMVAPAMTLLAKGSAPVVWLLERSGRLLLALLGQTKSSEEAVTDAEIHSMIAEAESSGVIEPEERRMIAGVMRLGDRSVRAVMTPRTDVEMFNVEDDIADVMKRAVKGGYARYVVWQGNEDNIIGVVQVKDLATAILRGKEPNLKRLVTQAPVLNDRQDALEVIPTLQQADVHIGLVHDEHGHFEGVVTATDILEAITGAFQEAGEDEEPDAVERDDGSVLFAGSAPIDSVMARLAIPLPEKRSYSTLAGFALERLGRLPHIGDTFAFNRYIFEIIDMDGRRIDRLLVKRDETGKRRRG